MPNDPSAKKPIKKSSTPNQLPLHTGGPLRKFPPMDLNTEGLEGRTNDPVAGAKGFLARTPAKPLAPPPPPEATGLRNMFSDLMTQVAEAEPIKTVLGIKDWLTRQNPGVEGLMPTTPEIVPGTNPGVDPTNHRLRLNQTFGKIPPR